MKKVLTALGLAVFATACGPYSQAAARDMATSHTCAWYDKCGEIGQGKTYASRDACDVDVRSDWNDLWPVKDCDGKIPADKLDTCLKAIDSTVCGNGLDFFNTVFNKCGKSSVCSEGSSS